MPANSRLDFNPEGRAADRTPWPPARLTKRIAVWIGLLAVFGCVGGPLGLAAPRVLPGDPLRPQQEEFLLSRIEAFRQSDPALRQAAIEDLGVAGDAAVPLLVRHVEASRNPVELRACFLAWERIGTPLAIQAARNAFDLKRLADDELALLALVLGHLGPGDRLPLLRDGATARRASPFRLASTMALGALADQAGLREVVESVDKEPLEAQRVATYLAAGVAGDRLVLPELLESLDDKAVDGRRAAAFAIGEIADPSALPGLLAALRREKSDPVRVAIALSLGRMEDPASRDALLDLTRARDPGVREAAWAALAARGDAVDQLAALLRDEKDVATLVRGTLACAAMPHAALTQDLLELLKSPHGDVRSAAGFALAGQRAKGCDADLLAWLKGEKKARIADALLVIGVLDVKAALAWLEGEQPTVADESMEQAVRRTLSGWRDVRLLRDQLEGRLRSLEARLIDRRQALLEQLVERVFDLDNIERRAAADGGGDGSGEGGGFGKPRIDPRNTSLERDLLEWFQRDPYFVARQQRDAGPRGG